MWRLISLFPPPPRHWPGFPLDYQTKIHLVISRDSSTDLLQVDETEGDMVNCRPSSLAMLLAYIVRKFPVAPKPFAQPSI